MGKKEEEKKKTCHYRRHIIRTSVCLFSCHLLLPPFMKPRYLRQRRLMRFFMEERGTKKEEWKHNQWWWFHWLFIIRWGWGLAGHYLIIHLERTVKFSLLQDFIRLHIVVFSPSSTTTTTTTTTMLSLPSLLQLTVSSTTSILLILLSCYLFLSGALLKRWCNWSISCLKCFDDEFPILNKSYKHSRWTVFNVSIS